MAGLLKRACSAFPAAAVLLIAVGLLLGGFRLMHETPPQYSDYNAAMEAYEEHDVNKAIQLLEQSLADYEAQKDQPWYDNMIHGRPSDELAALAHFHKGVLLLVKAQSEKRPGLVGQAVEELEASLKLNPGAPYADRVHRLEAARMDGEALTVKHDLDLLFQQQPEQQGNGKGEGKGDGQPQPAQPAPGDSPGDKPGHGSDDGI